MAKIPFSFPIPIPHLVPLVVLWASYYTCNIIRDVNPWFWKCGWKVNLFCDNHVIITYRPKKRYENSRFWSTHCFLVFVLFFVFFGKRTIRVNLSKFSPNTIFRIYFVGIFHIVKFNDFNGRLNKVNKRCWNIFDWPLCWWYRKSKYHW